MTTKNLWMVRAGQGGVLVDTFEDEGYCGTGSDVGRLGPIAPGESREAITQRLRQLYPCLLYTSPSPRDLSTSRMPSSA